MQYVLVTESTKFLLTLQLLLGRTKFKQEVKRGYEGYKNAGQQNWLQALCNAGMALELSLLYLLDLGSADLPVVFRWVSDIQTFCSAAVSLSEGTTTAAVGWAWRCWGRSPDLDQAFVKVCITLLMTLRQPNIM